MSTYTTYTEDFVKAGIIAGTGGALTAAGKYYTSDKVLNKVKAEYDRRLKIASAFEERYKPRVRFHYTMKDMEKWFKDCIKDGRTRNDATWFKNAQRNLNEFMQNERMTDEQIAKRLRKAISLDSHGAPRISVPHTFEQLWLTPEPSELFGGMDQYYKRLKAEFIPGRVKTDKDAAFLKKLRQKPFLLAANSKLKFLTNFIMVASYLGTTFFAANGLAKLFANKPDINNKPKPLPNEIQPFTEKEPQTATQTENKEIKTKFEKGFEKLGIPKDTELKEYVPQKGEYWISILKARYGADEKTAQKMANKIKEMIYGDAKASKQTPVMYLPETWTFDGTTYKYNDNTKADKTEKYSDNVKTEMGKMSKDLKYE